MPDNNNNENIENQEDYLQEIIEIDNKSIRDKSLDWVDKFQQIANDYLNQVPGATANCISFLNKANSVNNMLRNTTQDYLKNKDMSLIQALGRNLAAFGVNSIAEGCAIALILTRNPSLAQTATNIFVETENGTFSDKGKEYVDDFFSKWDKGEIFGSENFFQKEFIPLEDTALYKYQQEGAISPAKSIFDASQNRSVAPARRDPITVDLDGDGVETISSENGVYFDLDASGTAEKTGWIAPDDGLVVMDRDGNGTIDNGRELFGDATVLKDGSIASTGFEALAEQDTNNDGVIDASDENFSNMKVWRDLNQDGISQSEELRSLEETGIKKIHLDYLTVNTEDEQGNIQTRTSGFEFTDGRNGLTSEFLFDRDVVDTGTTDFSDVPDEIKNMAYLRGFGDVTDLYHAMKDDEVLRGLVEEFSDPENAASARTNFEKVLFRWTGVADISPSSRGGNIDARRLAVLERFFADDFEGWGAVGRTSKSSNPNAAAAVQLNSVYNNIFNSFSTTMNLQTHLKEYVTLGAIELNEDGTININNEVSDFLLNFQKLSDEIETGDEGPQTGDGETYLEKFELLARTVGVLGTTVQKTNFADYYAEKGGEYADGLKSVAPWMMMGSSSEDNLIAGNGNDRIYGFEGNDTVNAGNGNDVVYGGKGNDDIRTDSGDDILDGGTGNDFLYGATGNDTYIYRRGDGNDVVYDFESLRSRGVTDRFIFTDINTSDIDDITKSGDHLVITLKADGDESPAKIRFNCWYKNTHNFKMEKIEFADGTVWSTSAIENRVNIYGDDNDNELVGTNTSETFYGRGGDDTITGEGGNDTLYGAEGDDKLYGENGNDTVYGGKGNDDIRTDSGDDILDGGTGNDFLYGATGNDTYIYRRGDGNDVVYDFESLRSRGVTDRFIFTDINTSDIDDITKSGDHLVITLKADGDESPAKIRFNCWYKNTHNFKMEKIEFADGTVWSTSAIENRVNIYGDDNDNELVGTNASETFYGRGGDDTITGEGGNDTLYGAEGDDKLYGENGNDTVYGGKGNDDIRTDSGDDILDGGTGNDFLYGATGNDTYIYRRGDGNDVVYDFESLRSRGVTDRFIFTDINTSDIDDITKSGDHLVITLKADGDESPAKIRFNCWYKNTHNFKMEKIEFADGTVWSTSAIENRVNIYGDDNDNELVGTNASETFYGRGGDDTITGEGGNDTLYGAEGDDKLYGENGNDTVYGGKGNDDIRTDSGDDILDGGTGNDFLYGSTGSDTYIYRRGDGNDVVYDFESLRSRGVTDRFIFTDINTSDIDDITKSGDHLVITLKADGDESPAKIRFNCWYKTNCNYKMEEIEFADGSKWTTSDMENFRVIHGSGDDDTLTGTSGKENIYGYDGNDTISGGSGNDVITGDAGDDVIDGGSGNDRIIGGKGNDILSGGEGSDFYIYTAGDGSDIINEVNDLNSKSLNTDTLFLKGIVPDGINKIVRTEDDLKIHILQRRQ